MNFETDIPLSLAQAAHEGTSHVPERRAAMERSEYASTLARDYATFKAQAEAGGTAHLFEEEFARYRAGVKRHTLYYLASRSRVVSWFIAGPSNFPVRRMQKRSASAHRRLEELLAFRARARRAILRSLRPDLAPVSGDRPEAAVEALRVKLDRLESTHEQMVRANKVAKSKKLTKEQKTVELIGQGFTPGSVHRLLNPEYAYMGLGGFEPYMLSNSSANIRRVTAQLAAYERKVETSKQESVETEAGLYKVVQNHAANRVQLLFPGKPAEKVRAVLKRHGFRWSPREVAWQRHLNASIVAAASGGWIQTEIEKAAA